MATLDKYTRFIPHLAGNYPSLFYPLLGLCKGLPNRRTQGNTELTLEGYPRSGNTFAVRAFQFAQQRSVRLAHHLHVPAQVIQSARLGIPTCVIIREPEATVRSLVLKYPSIPVWVALRGYALFYETCWRYREHFVVADFNQVISDFGVVIDDINARFGTHFVRFQHTRPNVERIFEQLDRKATRADGGKVLGGFYPYPEREQAKQVVNLMAATRVLSRCRTIYRQFQVIVRQSEQRIESAEEDREERSFKRYLSANPSGSQPLKTLLGHANVACRRPLPARGAPQGGARSGQANQEGRGGDSAVVRGQGLATARLQRPDWEGWGGALIHLVFSCLNARFIP